MANDHALKIKILYDRSGAADLNTDLAKTQENMEGLNVHSREFRRLAMELDRIVPGVGEALIGAFNPEVIGIAGLFVGVQYLIKYIQGAKQAAAEFREEVQKGVDAIYSGLLAGMEAASQSARDYKEVLEETIPVMQELATQEAGIADLMKTKAEAAQKILEAQEQLALAEAGNDPIAQAGVKRRFGTLKGQQALSDEQSAIDQDETDKLKRRRMSSDLKDQMDAAKTASDSAGAYLKGLTPTEQANIEFQKKRMADPKNDPNVYPFNKNWENAFQSMTQSQNNIDEATAAAAGAKDKLKKAEDAYTENEKKINEFNDKIDEAGKVLAVHTDTFRKTDGLQNLTSSIKQVSDVIRDAQGQGYNMQGYIDQLHATLKDTHMTIMQKINALDTELRNIVGQLNTIDHRGTG